jgi:polyhydroxyalkanoate synthesis regulator phasin
MSIMWFYDEAREMQEYQNLSEAVRSLEGEYLEIRILLHEAEQALRTDPDSDYLKAKVKYLKKRCADLEKQAPRLASDVPLEIALFTPPHG